MSKCKTNHMRAIDVNELHRSGTLNAEVLKAGNINLTWTKCNYGGSRPWFICPCGNRVGKLYLSYHGFRCRHCYNLCYSSQVVDRHTRALLMLRKIRRKLGVSEDLTKPIIFKPKGMHQKTFDRLRKEAKYYERIWVSKLFGYLPISIQNKLLNQAE